LLLRAWENLQFPVRLANIEHLLMVIQINEPLLVTLTSGCKRVEVNEVRFIITCPSICELLRKLLFRTFNKLGQLEMHHRHIYNEVKDLAPNTVTARSKA
jgi:hypothetical protein